MWNPVNPTTNYDRKHNFTFTIMYWHSRLNLAVKCDAGVSTWTNQCSGTNATVAKQAFEINKLSISHWQWSSQQVFWKTTCIICLINGESLHCTKPNFHSWRTMVRLHSGWDWMNLKAISIQISMTPWTKAFISETFQNECQKFNRSLWWAG